MGAARTETAVERIGRGPLSAEVHRRREDGDDHAALLWRAGPGWRMIASSVLGGGLGPRDYVLNAPVGGDYRRTDPERHLGEIAAGCGAAGDGVGLLTAADVTRAYFAEDGGVAVLATVGIGRPTWAAADRALDEARIGATLDGNGPGTINIIVAVPAPLSDAALVNLIATATEAKVQALLENGYACTGTASDAVCAATLVARTPENMREPFGGVRSRWGARTARAVHSAVTAGARIG